MYITNMYFATSKLADIIWPILLILSFPVIFGAVILNARKKYLKSDKYLSSFSRQIFPLKGGSITAIQNGKVVSNSYDQATYDRLNNYLIENKLGSTAIPAQIMRIYEKTDNSKIYQMLSRAPTFFAKSVRVNNYDTTTYIQVKEGRILKTCSDKDLYNTAF